jgi:hypothetical protein
MPPNSLERMGEIMRVLHSDVQRAMELYTAERSPYAQRTYIRTFFAMIDGLTFQLKQVALERESEGFVSFSPSERDQLLEDTKFVRAPENIRLSLECLARAYGTNFRPAYGNHRWASLKRAIGIRHGVTHPKKLEDLKVSDAELKILMEGGQWYRDNLSEVFRHCLLTIVSAAVASISSKPSKH